MKFLEQAKALVTDKTVVDGTVNFLSLEEDLLYLAEQILEDVEYEYSTVIQALMNSGLVYQSVIDRDGEDRYKFTFLAKDLDRFAISYDNVGRYPNPEENNEERNYDARTVKVVSRFG
ncbi:hypothetical protein ABDB91_18880 [Desulfoscipio sp. XC116]|uniref:hypothetical protein n=1 Tax=Desulfoscipio sp. XC116 TaxID=3144975 RepID=UPI00325A748E